MLRFPGNGKPLDAGVRAKMERWFDADFSGVRVHEGPAARTMGALAFTLGDSLYFAPGLYNPTTRAGVKLLGHELTHVVQQRRGSVANPYGRGTAIVQDPDLEAEADAMGRRIADGWYAGANTAPQPATIIQRSTKRKKPPSSQSGSDESPPPKPAPKKKKTPNTPNTPNTLNTPNTPSVPSRRSRRFEENPWMEVVLYNSTKASGSRNPNVKVKLEHSHAACVINHDGVNYVFNGNDSTRWGTDLPPDGFETYRYVDHRPLMERTTGLLHHPELLKLSGGNKGVCYAAAHACAIIYQLGNKDWDDFVKYVRISSLGCTL